MTSRTRKPTLRRLAALGITSLALIAASPANAIYGGGYEGADGDAPIAEEPIYSHNENEDREDGQGEPCYLYTDSGGAKHYLPHGSTIQVKVGGNDTNLSYKCNDGQWEQEAQRPTYTHHYTADKAWMDRSGALTLMNAEYAGFYAAP